MNKYQKLREKCIDNATKLVVADMKVRISYVEKNIFDFERTLKNVVIRTMKVSDDLYEYILTGKIPEEK
ncbi:MAG: hypothetical protein AABY22_30825 [Nanoarchaeota archaeon]